MKFTRFFEEMTNPDEQSEQFLQELKSAPTTEIQQMLLENQIKLDEYRKKIEQLSSEYDQLIQSAADAEPHIKDVKIAKAEKVRKRHNELQLRCKHLARKQSQCQHELSIRQNESDHNLNLHQ